MRQHPSLQSSPHPVNSREICQKLIERKLLLERLIEVNRELMGCLGFCLPLESAFIETRIKKGRIVPRPITKKGVSLGSVIQKPDPKIRSRTSTISELSKSEEQFLTFARRARVYISFGGKVGSQIERNKVRAVLIPGTAESQLAARVGIQLARETRSRSLDDHPPDRPIDLSISKGQPSYMQRRIGILTRRRRSIMRRILELNHSILDETGFSFSIEPHQLIEGAFRNWRQDDSIQPIIGRDIRIEPPDCAIAANYASSFSEIRSEGTNFLDFAETAGRIDVRKNLGNRSISVCTLAPKQPMDWVLEGVAKHALVIKAELEEEEKHDFL